MNRILISIGLGLALLLLLGGCSKEYRQYSQYSRKGTLAQKDSAAFYFYERGDYEKAAFLLEDLQAAYRGTDRARTILYHYASAKYHSHLYVVAAYYFEQYTQMFPADEKAEECTYMVAHCYYLESAPHYLDQEFTKKAISQFDLYLNAFPFGSKTDEAEKSMEELEERLAHKAFEAARLYYNLENYKAANTSFEAMIQEYPASRYREEAQYMRFKSAVSLAEISVRNKRKNRYLDALDLYEAFVDKYPNSTFLKEAESLYVKTKRELGTLMAEEEGT
jgi:outer membrane protein assembly factor BamD